jgi:hypothetical protein
MKVPLLKTETLASSRWKNRETENARKYWQTRQVSFSGCSKPVVAVYVLDIFILNIISDFLGKER